MNCAVFFDDGLVPWERVFVLGDVDLINNTAPSAAAGGLGSKAIIQLRAARKSTTATGMASHTSSVTRGGRSDARARRDRSTAASAPA